MVNDVSKVAVGKPLVAGGVWRGPLGTPLPTDSSTALNVALKAAGYIGEDGVTESTERSTNPVKAWGGDKIRVLQTDYGVQYKFTFAEALNGEVLKAVHGAANVTTTPATSSAGTKHTVKLNSDQLPHEVYVFEIKDGNARIRIVVPDGQITEVGEVTYSDGDIVKYDVTVDAFFSPAIGGQVVKYIDDGVFSA